MKNDDFPTFWYRKPTQTVPIFFKLIGSDRTQTFTIDAAGELLNVAEYGHDPRSLNVFFRCRKVEKSSFPLIWVVFHDMSSTLPSPLELARS